MYTRQHSSQLADHAFAYRLAAELEAWKQSLDTILSEKQKIPNSSSEKLNQLTQDEISVQEKIASVAVILSCYSDYSTDELLNLTLLNYPIQQLHTFNVNQAISNQPDWISELEEQEFGRENN